MKSNIKIIRNHMEIEIIENGKIIAFASCIYHESKNEVEIRDFEIEVEYQNEEVRKYMLLKILGYSKNVDAKKIVHYCHGIGNGLSVDNELKWYLENGFVLDHVVYEITPCVVMNL